MKRRSLLLSTATMGATYIVGLSPKARSETLADDRAYWIALLTRVANPVLQALSKRELKKTMPVEAPHGNAEDRRQFTYLVAGRVLRASTRDRRIVQPEAATCALLRGFHWVCPRPTLSGPLDPPRGRQRRLGTENPLRPTLRWGRPISWARAKVSVP
jgi:hypothetical protein